MAGLLLARMTVLPALAGSFFLLAAFPLLLLGWFRPVPVLVAAGLAVLVGVPLSMHYVRRPVSGTPWWVPPALVVIAMGFAALQIHYRSAFVMVTRDPGSYLQFATWIEKHGRLPIPEDTQAFGSAQHLVHFNSGAFFQVGHVIVPQFMAGLPMMLAAAWWINGAFFALSLEPLLGAAAVLTFGGLAARLIGPRWAIPATLTLAVAFPEQFTSRSTYSEPVAQALLLGGLCLMIDAQSAEQERRTARILAALAGLALGVLQLVRLDGAGDTLPLIPWCGVLLVARRPQAVPLAAGMAAGTLYGVIDGVFLTRPYLRINMSSVAPLVLLTIAVIGVTLLAVLAAQRGVRLPRPRWLPTAAAALPVAVLAGAAVRAITASPVTKHTYSHHSLQWIIWWAGVPIVLAATAGAAMLGRRVLRGQSPEWTVPLLVFGWTIVVFLARPAITPDQPWASRRLVPAILPGCILLAAWACSRLTRQLKEHGFAGPPAELFVTCCCIALVVPPAWIAFKPHLGSTDRVTLRGLAVKSTYRGELAAIDHLCTTIGPDSTVVFTNETIAYQLLQAIRGMCGMPAAKLPHATGARVNQVISGIERTGRRAVLLGDRPADFKACRDGTVKKVMDLHTWADAMDLRGVPRSTAKHSLRVWMWQRNR